MQVRKVRDLTLVDIDERNTLVIACDSCGSVGMKEKDVLKVSPYYTGRFAARVALMEVICTGAKVITLTNAVCCEMEPTGREIIQGITDELESAGVEEVVLTGSTEENFPTYATGLGVTVIGVVEKGNIKINSAEQGCIVIAIGTPKVGREIMVDGDPDIVNYNHIEKLLTNPAVREIVPVGSKGILYEAQEIAKNSGLSFKVSSEIEKIIDINKSCGPSTVVLAAMKEGGVNLLREFQNIKVIGCLEA